ncbi:hypothetical protein [Brumimicrobium mesophilum]|uniref:hypothetical protein n=1 Tax=Brumimicrobium mesophilum TaxID=392717 RepID=UPI000D1411A5|nr:hypothetical protein [Brumimicrobium mesophilum]
MREKNITKEGIQEVKNLAESYFELGRIKSVQKTSQLLSRATHGLLTVILIMIGMSFFGFALAIYLGGVLDSYSLGFLIVGAIPLLTILLMRIFYKGTLGYLLNFFTRAMTRKI